MVDLRIGKKFQMIRKIGSGAFGEIFEGTDSTDGNQKI
jgi:hypothetical protein